MGHTASQSETTSTLTFQNILSLDDTCTVAHKRTVRGYKLNHSHNAEYNMIEDVDSTIIHNMFGVIQVTFKYICVIIQSHIHTGCNTRDTSQDLQHYTH